MGTLLEGWRFDIPFLIRHGFKDILQDPLRSLMELRYLKHQSIVKNTKIVLERGASFPSLRELLSYLSIDYTEIKMLITYWGYGIALRARKTSVKS